MIIVPYERVGDLIFGTKRGKIRELLGANFRTFSKAPGEVNTTDAYDELDIHIYYNENNEFEYIEMGVHTTPIFEGINLLQRNFEDMIKTLQKFDPMPKRVDKTSCTFFVLGIELYSGQGDGRIELVSAFSRKYAESIKDLDMDELLKTTDINKLITDLGYDPD